MKWPWQRRERLSPEAAELERGLQQTRLLIAQAYAGFNAACDGDLVESYVYEIQALQARYSYLLRQRKALDPQAPGAAGTKEAGTDGGSGAPRDLTPPSALTVA